MTKLLALDQSSKTTGFSVFNDKGELMAWGKITFSDDDLTERLYKLKIWLIETIQRHNIDFVVFEDIQLQNNVGNNVKTFKALAEVIGIIAETLFSMKIPFKAILASSWKSTLSIKGKNRTEQKRNAQNYVLNHYNLKVTQDEADSICIGTSCFN